MGPTRILHLYLTNQQAGIGIADQLFVFNLSNSSLEDLCKCGRDQLSELSNKLEAMITN